MGIFDRFKFSSKSSAKNELDVTGGSLQHALEQYRKLKRSGRPIDCKLYNQLGDMCRSAGRDDEARSFYNEAALCYISKENWTFAEAIVRKVERHYGGEDKHSLLASFEIAVGREMAASAVGILDKLERCLAPSDGDEISRVLDILGRWPVSYVPLYLRLSDFLCAMGRPEWAVRQLQVAAQYAQQSGDDKLVQEVEVKLRDLDPMGGSLDAPRRPKRTREEESPTMWADAPAPIVQYDPSDSLTFPPVSDVTPSEDTPLVVQKESVGSDFIELPDIPAVDSHVTPDSDGERDESEEAPQVVELPKDDGIVEVVGDDGRMIGFDANASVEHLLAQFRAGVQRELTPEDVADHYDLGIAFLSMELYEDAVQELQLAYASPEYRSRAVQGLAQAMIAQGQAVMAKAILDQELERLGGSGNDAHGLLYWRGRAQELMGQVEQARADYEEVSRLSPEFLDVSERLRSHPRRT